MNYPQISRAISHGALYALLSTILVIGSLLLSANSVQASRASVTSKLASTQSSVTILILDMSGSMSQNDPQGYRCSATSAFIDLSGVGNFIGVIGLDGDGTHNGPHNFGQALQWTPDPVDMSVQSSRDGLKTTIQQKSHNCAPDYTTPTYDALSKALHMLQDVSQSQEIPGSVVLLTDGAPDDGSPVDESAQINAIQQDLLPQFRQHQWPIDTIALGANGPLDESGTPYATFHDFLQGVSNATTGKFYDDSNGILPGVNPLNIAPFFTDIFARHQNRIVKDDIPPTALNGTVTQRNFNVTPYTTRLDVVVVKDQDAAKATLREPNNNVITEQTAGAFIYPNTYYVIYHIDNPQPGLWELDMRGSGQFLMKSLKISTLKLKSLDISQHGQAQAFATGQEIKIQTSLTNQDTPLTDTKTYTLHGTISYNGAAGSFSQPIDFQGDATGVYTGTTVVEVGKPAGAYQITVDASTVSLDNVVGSQTITIRVGQFPLPQLIGLDEKATSDVITAQSMQWDPILHFIYTLPILSLLGQWTLQGHPAGQALIKGQVTQRGQPYPGANVFATATDHRTMQTTPVPVQDDGGGNFHLQFPVTTSGLYTIQFQTSGTFADTHGDFGVSSSDVNVVAETPSPGEEALAWIITLVNFYVIFSLLNLMRFFVLKAPFGGWQRNQDGTIVGSYSFNRARPGFFQWFWQRNLLYSKQAGLPTGLKFRFKHSGGIEVQPDGPAGANWQKGDGSRLQAKYQEARELRYSPRCVDLRDEEETVGVSTYLIKSQINSRSTDADGYSSRYGDDAPYAASSHGKKRGGKQARSATTNKRSFYDNSDDF